MRVVEDAPARSAIHGVIPVGHGAYPAMRAGLGVVFAAAVCAGALGCGRAEAPAARVDPAVATDDAASQVAEPESANPPAGVAPTGDPTVGAAPAGVAPAPEFPLPQSPALPLELSTPEHQRYQQLRLETLRAMIEAARLALPIGPFQERIDAAARIALDDVVEAADRMEVIIADLREAIAAAGR